MLVLFHGQEIPMRLSTHERTVVLEAARRHFGEAAEVWLFGSRARDDTRGGDIDLLVELPAPVASPLSLSLAFEADIQSELDDPRVDVLVHAFGEEDSPICRLARETGVRL
jgi:predicted nucleotidyltransferase